MSERNCAVILAGGEGKRMKRNRPKCLSPVLFKPMFQWVINSAQGAEVGSVCVVTDLLNAQADAFLAEHNPGAVLARHMRDGVDIPCTDGVVIGPDVVVGRNCTILPGTILRGRTAVGDGCVLGPGTVLDGCTVGQDCVLDSVRGSGCEAEAHTQAGPFVKIGTRK